MHRFEDIEVFVEGSFFLPHTVILLNVSPKLSRLQNIGTEREWSRKRASAPRSQMCGMECSGAVSGSRKNERSGTVEDTYKMFAPNRGFLGSANLMVSFKLTPNQPLLPWQPIVVIKHKISYSYNSPCIEDTSPLIAPTRGFSGTANLTV